MARNFRRARQLHPIAELNVTNLIDLGFTLLIIFMIATPLINQEQTIRVDLPHASTLPQPFQAITIDRTGRYFYGDSKTPVSFEELQSRLHELAGLPDDKRPVIRVRADLSLQYQKVVTLMDELAKNQLFKFSLDTQAVK
jgi:biopolymer transport protein ExbD